MRTGAGRSMLTSRGPHTTDRRLASSTRLPAEPMRRGPGDLLGRDVVEVLGDAPAVPERVDDLPVAVAPEHVLQWLVHPGSSRDRAFPQGGGVVGGDVQRAVGPTYAPNACWYQAAAWAAPRTTRCGVMVWGGCGLARSIASWCIGSSAWLLGASFDTEQPTPVRMLPRAGVGLVPNERSAGDARTPRSRRHRMWATTTSVTAINAVIDSTCRASPR